MNPALEVTRTNTILYCDRWADTVAFYRDALGLTVTHATDWFIEVHINESAHLSIADAARATISAGHGAGITLSWEVPDLSAAHSALVSRGIPVSDVSTRWESTYVELRDPEGTRIELWSPARRDDR